MIDANVIRTIHQFQRGGEYYIPSDSGTGAINRGVAKGQVGGRTATLETFFDFFIDNVPAPDEAKLLNPEIEQQIRFHPDVVAAHRKRTFQVSSMPWRIEPNPMATDKTVAQQVADHCKEICSKLPKFYQLIEHLQYAIIVGGQGIEFRWHREANGVEYPVEFYPVHMSRFLFDRLGNMALLTRDNAVWGVYVSSDPQAQYARILPRGKFLYHIYRQGQGPWSIPQNEGYVYYGEGEDVPLYYTVTFDIFCLKFRMKFLERWGMPPTYLYYAENRKMTRELVRVVDSLRGESVVTMPMPINAGGQNQYGYYKAELQTAPAGSYDFFESFSDRYTRPRVNMILLGDAGANAKSEERGGYSDDVSRTDKGANLFVKRDARCISETITTQMMPPIALARFPNLPSEYYPIFSLEPKEEKDRMQELQILEQGAKLAPIAVSQVYDAGDFAVPKIDPETGQMEDVVGGQQNSPDGLDMGMIPDKMPKLPVGAMQAVQGKGIQPDGNLSGQPQAIGDGFNRGAYADKSHMQPHN